MSSFNQQHKTATNSSSSGQIQTLTVYSPDNPSLTYYLPAQGDSIPGITTSIIPIINDFYPAGIKYMTLHLSLNFSNGRSPGSLPVIFPQIVVNIGTYTSSNPILTYNQNNSGYDATAFVHIPIDRTQSTMNYTISINSIQTISTVKHGEVTVIKINGAYITFYS